MNASEKVTKLTADAIRTNGLEKITRAAVKGTVTQRIRRM